MRSYLNSFLTLLPLLLVMAAKAILAQTANDTAGHHSSTNGHEGGVGIQVSGQVGTPWQYGAGDLFYNDGPVMTGAANYQCCNGAGTINLYLIFYGNWATSSQNIIKQFVIDAQNTLLSGMYIFNNAAQFVVPGGTYSYGSSTPFGTTLYDSSIISIVKDRLQASTFPVDSNGVYGVILGNNIYEYYTSSSSKGFCNDNCGWHDWFSYNSAQIKYFYTADPIGHPQCSGAPSGTCVPQSSNYIQQYNINWQTQSPNNDPGADSVIQVLSHEVRESVADPLFDAWHDPNYHEVSDKCNFYFQTTMYYSSGPNINTEACTTNPLYYSGSWVSNVQWGQSGNRYLVQTQYWPSGYFAYNGYQIIGCWQQQTPRCF